VLWASVCGASAPAISHGCSHISHGGSAVVLVVHHHVHLVFLQFQHFIEGIEELVELVRLTLLLPFHVIDSALRPHNHAAADDQLQYEDQHEDQDVLVDGNVVSCNVSVIITLS